ncbi:hypothetical protein N7520_010796 [Penicillium odoratum]|uniref:uncharacterized protein n=1 Tax=Penicillium odoratum TaxID=1167516 RepID=UPI002546FDE3|nr:uncharacterized protein N7520_010796 [Penicillium odoratum]KAJ5745614.1 hypothetical protein N7520_010796 [Penicillium odoratum]
MPRNDFPAAKRRKVRKGTQSCWECKRRKVRCTVASENTICNNCRRRGTACVSQELPETPVPSGNQVDARLGRVEELIEILTQNTGPNQHQSCYPDHAASMNSLAHDEGKSRRKAAPSIRTTANAHNEMTNLPQEPPLNTPRGWGGPMGKYEKVTRELIAAWPSQDDLDIICTLPGGPTMRLIGDIFSQSSSVLGDMLSLKDALKLPPPGSHPILIARKFFMLGAFIHGVPLSKMHELGRLGTLYLDIMSRVVDTAIRLVTTNDELICSVEGIECIMMEALYQNHSGNLHRSWMAVHRATAVAQMMVVSRGLDSPSLKFLESATRAVFNADQICFRLVQMDRYLSIMLGLPPTSLEATFATPKALEGCSPMDRLERIHCLVAEHILRRTEADLNNLNATHEDEKLLQKIAADMPAQWWLTPNFAPSNDDPELLGDTVRLVDQFAHYHLLIRLHLPYMLRASADHRYDHSKITAVTASREIISRYLAFRTSSPVHFYCRGDECLAFIAIIVLCIAHMESRKKCQQSAEASTYSTVFNFLAHSRPSDRAMMERTLEIMKSTASHGLDGITFKLARIIHHLLVIEASADSGTLYSTSSSKSDEGDLEFVGKLTDGGKALHIHIPYFGRINFERRVVFEDSIVSISNQIEQDCASLPRSPCPFTYQSGDQLAIDNPPLQFRQLPSPNSNEPPEFNGDLPPEQVYGLVGALFDNWDLQGLDLALFDSLFRGTEVFNREE